MTFDEVVQTTGTCRFYRPDPIPDAVLDRVLDAVRYAPTGGNRQPVRLLVVRDPERKRRLKEWYLPVWDAYAGAAPRTGGGRPARLVANADHFARHLDEVPVLILVCAVEADIYATDRALGRLSVVGGASVYPAVQNLLLKARDEGLGSALTTLLCAMESQIKPYFEIPDGVLTAALLALGYPARPFPTRLTRRPVTEMVFGDVYGRPLRG